MTKYRAARRQRYRASYRTTGPHAIVLLHDEDWGDAVVDLQLLLDEDLEAGESVPARSLQVADPRDA